MIAMSILIKADASPHPPTVFLSLYSCWLVSLFISQFLVFPSLSFFLLELIIFIPYFSFTSILLSLFLSLLPVTVCTQCEGSRVNSWKTFRH